MRIGIDASKLMPPRDGIGTYVRSVILTLVERAPEHELVLYPTLHSIEPRIVEQLFGVRPDNLVLAPHATPRSGDVDVFHATAWHRPSRFDGPVLMTCYDTTVLSHPRAHELANRVHCLGGLLQARLEGDTFLTLSDATAREVESWFEVPADRIEVVPAAVDSRFAAPGPEDQEAVLARFGLRSPYVLAVGTLEPRKNLARLLAAWRDLDSETRDDVPLVVVGGTGWGDPGLVEQLETTEGVRLLGHVADEALPALYAAASVFVYPSLAEGFGFPVLEAMACGTPVVTSDRSSLPEVAGDAALLVDPEDESAIRDAIARVLGDPDTRARLVEASRARARDFSWRRTIEGLLDCYARLAARPSGGRPEGTV